MVQDRHVQLGDVIAYALSATCFALVATASVLQVQESKMGLVFAWWGAFVLGAAIVAHIRRYMHRQNQLLRMLLAQRRGEDPERLRPV